MPAGIDGGIVHAGDAAGAAGIRIPMTHRDASRFELLKIFSVYYDYDKRTRGT